MALSRLLQVKPGQLFRTPGLVNPPKFWGRYCTYSSSNAEAQKSLKFDEGEAQKSSLRPKKLTLAKEQKAAAVESFVVKYMNSHQGTFPKVIRVQENVGGSFYTVRGILTALKKKMVGNPQLQNPFTSDTSDSTVDVTASEVITAQKSETTSELIEVKSKAMNSELNNGNTLPSSMSSMLREYSSEEMINGPDFVSVQTHGNADDTETVKLETMVQSSTSLLNLGNNEKNYTNSTSHVVEKSSSGDSVTLDDSNVVKSYKYVNGHQNHQPETERMTSASRTPNVRSEVDGMHSVPFGGPQKTMGITDLLTRTWKPTIERNDIMRASSPEFVNEARGPRGEKGSVILSLINGIEEIRKIKLNLRSQKGTTSNNMDQTCNKTAIEGMQCEAESLRSDNGERYSPTHGCAMVKETNNFKGSDSTTHGGSLSKLFPDTTPMRKDSKGSGVDISALDSMKSKSSQKIPLPKSKHGFKNTWVAEKEADDNIVLVRFLHASVKKNEIETLFNNCGYIARIDLHKGGLFKMACIYFMAKEGMQNALKETGLILRNTNLVVEAACSKDNIPCKTVIPNLIGYPEVPASFVKNPTRTVMIKELTPDLSSHDIGEALAFCGSKISGFFFGSSSSVAYVELATEEAKQRALERNSITVSGKLLRIFRIDAPRTTVVRISNLWYPEVQHKFEAICGSFGQVKHLRVRSKDIVDVYFDITEWPNMLRILNGLNGLPVFNSQWIAQPAPIFPPEVLHILWKHPGQRRHLITLIHRSMQKLEEYPTAHKVALASMAKEYYQYSQ